MKKEYRKPCVRAIRLVTYCILAGSTGATGEDVPWASSKRGSISNELYWYEEEE